MSIYSLYDLYSKEITLTSDIFDTLIYKDVLDLDDDLLGTGESLSYDIIRNDKIYDYTIKLKEFLDTRQNRMEKVPTSFIERSGSNNSVMMTDINGVSWKRLAKPVEGLIRITNVDDTAIVLYSTTMKESYFVTLDSCYIDDYDIVLNNDRSTIRSCIFKQEEGETEWSNISPEINVEVSINDLIVEKCDISKNKICLMTKALSLGELKDISVLEKTGSVSKVISVDEKREIIKNNDIGKSAAASKSLISFIAPNGQIVTFGQTSAADLPPPYAEYGYRTLNGDYNGFVGVTKDNKIYCWGSSAITYLKSKIPTGNDFVDCDIGSTYGLALKDDGSIVWFGTSTTSVGPTQVPTGNNFVKIGCGYSYAFALDDMGVLHGIGNVGTDTFSKGPQNVTEKIVDFEVRYRNGIALTKSGKILTWGDIGTMTRPDLTGKKVAKLLCGGQVSGVITDVGELIPWGYYASVTRMSIRKNVSFATGYSYHGIIIDVDGNMDVFVRDGWTSDPDVSITTSFNSFNPKPLATLSGDYFAGNEYDLTLEKPISLLYDPYLVTTNLYISQTGNHDSLSDYTHIPAETITLVGTINSYNTGSVNIKYKSTDLYTKSLSFVLDDNNPTERISKINLILDKSKIGE